MCNGIGSGAMRSGVRVNVKVNFSMWIGFKVITKQGFILGKYVEELVALR